MNPIIERLIGQAVIQYMNGNYKQFRRWTQAAREEYDRETERNRLHATIREIMESKGVNICSKLQAIGQ
ncbi:MAG TPA: hypothetical protein VD757_01785 [Candidatus Nitrosocosmicus sp.]|nr:hypothetical protein [Candidatus Nitrosocosmicus sp.]